MKQKVKLNSVIARPEIDLYKVMNYVPRIKKRFEEFTFAELESAEILIQYEGYLQKELDMVEKMEKLESVLLDNKFANCHSSLISSLS